MSQLRLYPCSTRYRGAALQVLQASMTKKNIMMIVAAVVLAAVYAVYFTDWFKPKTVQIFHTSRNLHPRALRGGALPSLIFGINQQLKLTEIRVVPADGYQTNHNALPVWHLISD